MLALAFRPTAKRMLAVVVVLVFLAAADNKEEATKLEKAKFEGNWLIVTAEYDGKEIPKDKLKGGRLHFKDDALVSKGVKVAKDNECTYSIDPTKDPKEIDIIAKDGVIVQGIYLMEGNRLKVCCNTRDNGRPKNFEAKAGQGMALWLLRREKKTADGN